MDAARVELDLPRWAVMWALAVAIYGALKLLSWIARREVRAPRWKHAAYLFAWPGMDADAFLGGRAARRPRIEEWCFAFFKMALGLALVAVASRAGASLNAYLLGWIGMLGIVLTLHFGLFHVLSCCYRRIGIDAVPIMNWPIVSQSVTEFWGRRWNLAFRDLSHRFLFRPLAPRCGAAGALWITFLASGLVHDVVISLPAGGGYGLPTAFFLIQAGAISLERTRAGRKVGLGRGWRGRLFCAAALLLPCPLLFPPAFVLKVVVPFVSTLGELL